MSSTEPLTAPMRGGWSADATALDWQPVDWDTALADIAARVRAAIADGGTFSAWTVAGHAEPDVVLVLPSYLHAGHVVSPAARRIASDKAAGSKLVVLDPRTSEAAALADVWLAPWPGSEAAILLAVASTLLRTGSFDHGGLRRWFDWDSYLAARHPRAERDFDTFVAHLTEDLAHYTAEFAAEEAQVPADRVEEIAELVASSGGRVAAHVWRGAGAEGADGRQTAHALRLVLALTGGLRRAGGMAWFEALSDPDRPGLHVAHGPLWPDAAELADYVLPLDVPAEHGWDDTAFWWRGGDADRSVDYRRCSVARHEVDVDAGELVLAEYPERGETSALWLNALDAARRGVVTGDLVRINARGTYTVAQVRVTDSDIRPGVCAVPGGSAVGRLRKVRLEFARPGDRCA